MLSVCYSFSCFRGLYEIKKTSLVTFNANFQLDRQDKILRKACDLSITFITCQNYLLSALQLIPEDNLVCSISFWSSVCFIFLGIALSVVLQHKPKTLFHGIKSIYRLVNNISHFSQKYLCPLHLSIITWNQFGYFTKQSFLSRLLIIKH